MLVNDNTDSRRVVEQCYTRHKTTLNPIIDWTDADVWEFIQSEKPPMCGLYECGFKRLGCIGCPMAGTKGREVEFARWPKYKENYLRAFAKMLEERTKRGKIDATWRAGTYAEDVFNWWMKYDILPGQTKMILEEMEEYDAQD